MLTQLEPREVPAADISGTVFYDANNDGIQNYLEPNAANIGITCTPVMGGSPTTGTTDVFGAYTFANMASDSYLIAFTAPSGYSVGTVTVTTPPNQPMSGPPVNGSTLIWVGSVNVDVDAALVVASPPVSPPPAPPVLPPISPPPAGESNYVSVVAANATELGADGWFDFIRSGSVAGPLTVTYLVGGIATPGDDYTALSGVVEFPTGQSIVRVPLHANDDWYWEDDESVTIAIQEGSGYMHNNAEVVAFLLDGKKAPPAEPMPLPAAAAGAATPSVDYKTFTQGADGACWFASALVALAYHKPNDVKAMISDQGGGKYFVQMPYWPNKVFEVHPNAPGAKTTFTSDWVWARAIHLALGIQIGNSARTERTVGWEMGITYLTNHGTTENTNLLGSGFGSLLESVHTKLGKANNQKIVLASPGTRTPTGTAATALSGMANGDILRSEHVYAILSYDQQNDRIRLRNPWGNTSVPAARKDAAWGPGEFWMTLAEYQENMEFMTYES